MNKFFTLGFCLLLSVFVNAQRISGVVKDEQGKSIVGASITLKKAKDSAVVKIAIADAEGKYSFNNVQVGKYFITVNSVGFTIAKSAIFIAESNETNVPSITLNKASKKLDDITVISRKPMIEVKADKTIFNVENSINAVGSDAFELVRKSPGVVVDKDDNISLSGKNGVRIYIDGRPSPLSGKDLAEFLKSLQSSQIEAIELITNPSAKYDAAGNAGIINIKLKKNKLFGTNGSVNAGYAIGIYSKYNAGFSLNHRNNKVNIFGTYNFNNNYNESTINSYRKQLDTLFDQKGVWFNAGISNNFKVGMDYTIDKKNTFGIIVNGNLNTSEFDNNSHTNISYIPTNIGYRVLVANNTQQGYRNSLNLNLNYKYTDTAGRELNVDGNYGTFRLKNDQLQPNYYLNYAGTMEQERRVYNMISPSDINIANIKADYEQNYNKGRLGFGGKLSYVKTTNDFQRYNVLTSTKVLDTLRSNKFDYEENINAAYVNYNKQYKHIMIQIGVRVENTIATGKSTGYKQVGSNYIPYDSSFKRNYTDVFPSAAITFNKNPMSQWSLSYSRRIDRPSYQDLNPFEFKLDEYSYKKGNTQLTPQYTNAFSLTHSYKYTLNTKLSYSHVKDVFTQLVDTAEKSKSFITQKNLATQDVVSLNISYPYQHNWYSFFTNLGANYSHYKANFGAGRTIDLDAAAISFYMQNSFKLGRGYTAELTAMYNSPSIWQGTFKSKAMGGVDVGIQKLVLQGKGNIKLAVTDIFHTMQWGGVSEFAGQYVSVNGGWESRQFKINFSYRFGKTTVRAARQRKTGDEDEKNRINGSGGGPGGN